MTDFGVTARSEAGSTRSGDSWEFLAAPVAAANVALFRIAFGLIACWWVGKHFLDDSIQYLFVEPPYHFHYWGLSWISAPPAGWANAEFLLIGLAAVLITIGAAYRLASLCFALGFTHLFLCDKCLYQNHYYLLTLCAWLLVLIPAHRQWSVDAKIGWTRERGWVPRWALWLLRLQIGLPYFFGGVAKLNSDWLAGQPVGMMLSQRGDVSVLGPLLAESWCVTLFVWGGIVFDLAFLPLALYRPTRWLALTAASLFHLTNASVFTIGVFPWFMLLSAILYVDPRTLVGWGRRLRLGREAGGEQAGKPEGATDAHGTARYETAKFELASAGEPGSVSRSVRWLLVMYVGLQLGLPWRHYLLPGTTSWTEEAHCFSWRMLVRGKQPALRCMVTDPRSGRTGAVDLRRFVSPLQLHRVAREPRLIHQLVGYIAADLAKAGFPDAEIRVVSLVSLNGRRPQLMIDPSVDLSRAQLTWLPPSWIVPLHEPLPNEPWDVPMQEWEQRLQLNDRSSQKPKI